MDFVGMDRSVATVIMVMLSYAVGGRAAANGATPPAGEAHILKIYRSGPVSEPAQTADSAHGEGQDQGKTLQYLPSRS